MFKIKVYPHVVNVLQDEDVYASFFRVQGGIRAAIDRAKQWADDNGGFDSFKDPLGMAIDNPPN